jgi:RHS repeat-associated protein
VFDEDSFSPVAKIKGDKQYSILSDYLGTPTHVFDFEGDVIWETRLDSYGKMQLEKGKIGSCPFRYQGQYEDYETGLYYNRFRYYSPEEGGYISQDPIGIDSGVFGFYNHVHNPNMWIDVFGLDCKKVKELQEGGNGTVVRVKSKKEAHDLLMKAFPDAQKVRGIGAQDAVGVRKKNKMDQFKKNDGKVRYRKDYAMNHETGRVHGHDDPKGTGHGENPHINIKKSDGKMVRIDIVK